MIRALMPLLFFAVTGLAQSPPQQFTANFTNGSQVLTVDFERFSIRSPNFNVLTQNSSGVLNASAAPESATYLGTPVGIHGAVACATRKANGTLLVRIFFEDASTWSSTTPLAGGAVNVSGDTNWARQFPTFTITTNPGTNQFAAEVGIDSSWTHFNRSGLNVADNLSIIEHSVLCANVLYLREAGIIHRIGRVVMRGDANVDPYKNLTGGALLTETANQWNTVLPPDAHDMVAMLSASSVGGGLAFVGVVGTASGNSVNDSDPDGDFSVIWRHEAGHNWGANHFEGGGQPEGATIMSGNNLSRISSPELSKIVAHRNTRTALDNMGPLAFPIPPRASMDVATATVGSVAAIDVLANDHDGNGQPISILSFDAVSKLGGTIARSIGTGPNGRDRISIQMVADHGQPDWFQYRIADSSGRTATGIVYVQGENPSTKLAGAIIGSNGSWNNNPSTTKAAAMDGNLNTYYDGANGSGDWAGRDLGAASTLVVTKIKFAPRAGQEGRMNGGQFQVSNTPDFSTGVVTLFTISSAPPSGSLTTISLTNNTAYRYVRYLGPPDGFCNVAEIEFWGAPPAGPNPPNGLAAFGVRDGQIELTWNSSTLASTYNVLRASVTGGAYTTIATDLAATGYTDSALSAGQRYYYVVSAANNIGQSGHSREANAIATATPGGHWKFNEAIGSIALDSSPSQNHGAINNATWVPGFMGTALQFNGANSSVTLGTGPSISGTNNFTLSAWIKTTATTRGIIIQQRDQAGFNGEYVLSANANGTIQFMLYGDNNTQFDFATTQNIRNGQWHHIVAVRDGLIGRIYIDGNPTPAATATGPAVRNLSASISVAIGRDVRDNNSTFNGAIDEVRIYKTIALAGPEVQILYNSYFLPIQPEITGNNMTVNGFTITGIGGPGHTNILRAASDLVHPIVWAPIQTNVAGSDGSFIFTDGAVSGFQTRYYRVSAP